MRSKLIIQNRTCSSPYLIKIIIRIETIRKQDKAVANAVGYFHEKVLQNANGWEKYHEYSMDVCNLEKTTFLQLKNKYNTMNSSSTKHLKQMILKLVKDKPTATVVLGIVNDTTEDGVDKEFISEMSNVRKITGRKLYEFVTNCPSAYDDLQLYIQLRLLTYDQSHRIQLCQ